MDTPVVTGEMPASVAEYERWIDGAACDITQPDYRRALRLVGPAVQRASGDQGRAAMAGGLPRPVARCAGGPRMRGAGTS
ncbi:hypothetical protein [Nocardiopsis ganjiahuensis]|uniref:hypothetical protein n=1 Tax=Nocardiopsis ganjiahuensis TaxID=239984 RepID=UPI0023AA1B81|nr:hypothetical protein [Nocardiopsis ganjiahuensis]